MMNMIDAIDTIETVDTIHTKKDRNLSDDALGWPDLSDCFKLSD